MAKKLRIRHRLLIAAALYTVAAAVVIGVTYQVVKFSENNSGGSASTSPKKQTGKLATLNLAEYDVSLEYHPSAGYVTYTVEDTTYDEGSTIKIINFTNDALKNPKAECEGENMPSYSHLGSLSVQPAIDSGNYIPTSYIKSGDNYLVYNSEGNMNMPVDGPCFSETLSDAWGQQRMDLYNSFMAQSTPYIRPPKE